ncbi:hypothetical protein ACWGA0_13510 [Streptomyces erythrochromogenes]
MDTDLVEQFVRGRGVPGEERRRGSGPGSKRGIGFGIGTSGGGAAQESGEPGVAEPVLLVDERGESRQLLRSASGVQGARGPEQHRERQVAAAVAQGVQRQFGERGVDRRREVRGTGLAEQHGDESARCPPGRVRRVGGGQYGDPDLVAAAGTGPALGHVQGAADLGYAQPCQPQALPWRAEAGVAGQRRLQLAVAGGEHRLRQAAGSLVAAGQEFERLIPQAPHQARGRPLLRQAVHGCHRRRLVDPHPLTPHVVSGARR